MRIAVASRGFMKSRFSCVKTERNLLLGDASSDKDITAVSTNEQRGGSILAESDVQKEIGGVALVR
jgi:hypothetical protein